MTPSLRSRRIFFFHIFRDQNYVWIVCITHNNFVVVATVRCIPYETHGNDQLHRRTLQNYAHITQPHQWHGMYYFFIIILFWLWAQTSRSERQRKARTRAKKNEKVIFRIKKTRWRAHINKFLFGQQFKLDNLHATNLRWEQMELGQGYRAVSLELDYAIILILTGTRRAPVHISFFELGSCQICGRGVIWCRETVRNWSHWYQ